MRHILQSFAVTGLVQLLGFANAVLIARLLGPEGRGELAAVILYPMLLYTVGGIALNDAVVYRAATGKVAPERLLPSIAALSIGIGVALGAAGLLLFPILYRHYPPEVLRTASVYLTVVPVGLLVLHLASVFHGMLDYATWNLLRLLTTVITVAAVGALFLVGTASVFQVAMAYLGGFAAAAVLALVLAARRGWLARAPAAGEIGALLRFALPLELGVVVQMANDRLDQVLIANLLPPVELGLYVAALAIATIASVPAGTLANVGYPRIAAAAVGEGAGPIVERYLRVSLGLALPIAILLWAAAPYIVPLFYGEAFAPAVPILRWLVIGTVGLSARAMLTQAVKAAGHPGAVLRVETAGLLLNAAALAALLPLFGAVGAAIGYALVQWAITVHLALVARRVAGIDLGRFVRDTPGETLIYARRLAIALGATR